MLEVVPRRCSLKKLILKFTQNSRVNTCATVSFSIKLQISAGNFIKKETLTRVFSCEFCEFFKNTFFRRTPTVAASEKRIRNPVKHLRFCFFPDTNLDTPLRWCLYDAFWKIAFFIVLKKIQMMNFSLAFS